MGITLSTSGAGFAPPAQSLPWSCSACHAVNDQRPTCTRCGGGRPPGATILSLTVAGPECEWLGLPASSAKGIVVSDAVYRPQTRLPGRGVGLAVGPAERALRFVLDGPLAGAAIRILGDDNLALEVEGWRFEAGTEIAAWISEGVLTPHGQRDLACKFSLNSDLTISPARTPHLAIGLRPSERALRLVPRAPVAASASGGPVRDDALRFHMSLGIGVVPQVFLTAPPQALSPHTGGRVAPASAVASPQYSSQHPYVPYAVPGGVAYPGGGVYGPLPHAGWHGQPAPSASAPPGAFYGQQPIGTGAVQSPQQQFSAAPKGGANYYDVLPPPPSHPPSAPASAPPHAPAPACASSLSRALHAPAGEGAPVAALHATSDTDVTDDPGASGACHAGVDQGTRAPAGGDEDPAA